MVKMCKILIVVIIGMLIINMVDGSDFGSDSQADNSDENLNTPLNEPANQMQGTDFQANNSDANLKTPINQPANQIQALEANQNNDERVQLYDVNDSKCNAKKAVNARAKFVNFVNDVAIIYMWIHPIFLLPQTRVYGFGQGESYNYQGNWFTVAILDWEWSYVAMLTYIGCYKPALNRCLGITTLALIIAMINLPVFLIDYFQGGNWMWFPALYSAGALLQHIYEKIQKKFKRKN